MSGRTGNARRVHVSVAILLLAVIWVLGLFLGHHTALNAHYNNFSLMRTATQSCVSIIGVFAVLIFPLLISAALARFLSPLSILPIVFLKAFGFSYCSCTFVSAYGSAGWLVRFLVLFSDSLIVTVLLWFWFRRLTGTKESLKKDLVLSIIFAVFIGCLDYFMVSPFLVTLFHS